MDRISVLAVLIHEEVGRMVTVQLSIILFVQWGNEA
jgi:hypothetical protein